MTLQQVGVGAKPKLIPAWPPSAPRRPIRVLEVLVAANTTCFRAKLKGS